MKPVLIFKVILHVPIKFMAGCRATLESKVRLPLCLVDDHCRQVAELFAFKVGYGACKRGFLVSRQVLKNPGF